MLSRIFGPGTGLAPQGDPFGTLQREMNRVFDEVFRGFPANRAEPGMMGRFAPCLDVQEAERGLELTAELPGMSEQDVDLRIEGDLLILAGEKKQERKEEQAGGIHLSERSYGWFQRAFSPPFAPDPNQVEARFDKGVLRISLPRPAEQKKPSRIQIRGATEAGGQPRVASEQGGRPAAEQDNQPGEQAWAG